MSEKLSFGAVYNRFNPINQLFRKAEIEYCVNSPQFIKVDCLGAQRFNLNYNDIDFSFSYNLHCGMVRTVSSLLGVSSRNLRPNDRLYLAKSHSFSSLGHTQPNKYPVSRNIREFEYEFYSHENELQRMLRKQAKNLS